MIIPSGFHDEELSERDIIMINRGMEIRRRTEDHGFLPLDVHPPPPHHHLRYTQHAQWTPPDIQSYHQQR